MNLRLKKNPSHSGHNMVLDVCHTLNQFCSPLPATYSEFKEMCSAILPNILDTKANKATLPYLLWLLAGIFILHFNPPPIWGGGGDMEI